MLYYELSEYYDFSEYYTMSFILYCELYYESELTNFGGFILYEAVSALFIYFFFCHK